MGCPPWARAGFLIGLWVAAARIGARLVGSRLTGLAHLAWDGTAGLALLTGIALAVGLLPGGFTAPALLGLAAAIVAAALLAWRGDPLRPFCGALSRRAYRRLLDAARRRGNARDAVQSRARRLLRHAGLSLGTARAVADRGERRTGALEPALLGSRPACRCSTAWGSRSGASPGPRTSTSWSAHLLIALAADVGRRVWGGWCGPLAAFLLLGAAADPLRPCDPRRRPRSRDVRGGGAGRPAAGRNRRRSRLETPRGVGRGRGGPDEVPRLPRPSRRRRGVDPAAIATREPGTTGCAARPRHWPSSRPALLLVAPWLLANALTLANPVAPVLAGVLPPDGLADGGAAAFQKDARGGLPGAADPRGTRSAVVRRHPGRALPVTGLGLDADPAFRPSWSAAWCGTAACAFRRSPPRYCSACGSRLIAGSVSWCRSPSCSRWPPQAPASTSSGGAGRRASRPW